MCGLATGSQEWYTFLMHNAVEKGKKVFVAMSGGVDSSVAAFLLQKEGYDVTGVFMKVWQPFDEAQGKPLTECTWREDRQDAMRVAARLGVPFETWNFEEEYKRDVVEYMISEYRAGRTPNPDVMCNRHIKFGVFLREALRRGADYIATGHYARIQESGIRNQESQFHLLAGVDKNKDQSYFLYALGQEELSRTLFPIGKYLKPKVRIIAQKAGLPTAQKKDSQGLCFIGKLDMREFLSHYIAPVHGEVMTSAGKVIGEHRGAAYYTLGQRHGFSTRAQSPHESPYYIVAKDIGSNTLTVAHTPKTAEKEVSVRDTRWTLSPPIVNKRYTARLRYRQRLLACSVRIGSNADAVVAFTNALGIIPAGQSLVLYDGDECLGGGIIV